MWREYGALSVTECVADAVTYGELTSFPRAVQAGEAETAVFAWIVYESREARDEVNKKVMAHPRSGETCRRCHSTPSGCSMAGSGRSWRCTRRERARAIHVPMAERATNKPTPREHTVSHARGCRD